MDNKETKQQPAFHSQYHQPEPVPTPTNGNGQNGGVEDGILRIVMLLISSIILGVAMLSGAFVAAAVIGFKVTRVMDNLFPILIVVALSYLVGWIVALAGIRLFNNLVLPYVMNLYAWGTLAGILVLYAVILDRLFWQAYKFPNFVKYVVVMGAAFAALLGFHLLIENHSLRPFSVPLLIFNLGHLYLIVVHYVFMDAVLYEKLIYDIIFFLGMTAISIFMLIHIGVLAGTRSAIDRIFEKNPNGH